MLRLLGPASQCHGKDGEEHGEQQHVFDLTKLFAAACLACSQRQAAIAELGVLLHPSTLYTQS